MKWWLIALEALYVVLVVFTSYRIIVDTRSSTKSLAYLLTVIFLPFIGVIIYFSVGVNYKKRQIYSKKILASGSLQSMVIQLMHERSIKTFEDEKFDDLDKRIPQFLFRANNSPLAGGNKVEILKNGEEKFPKVFQAIEKATKSNMNFPILIKFITIWSKCIRCKYQDIIFYSYKFLDRVETSKFTFYN